MKITIEIPDEEIKEKVFELVTQRLAKAIFDVRYGEDRRYYIDLLKKGVNAILKEHSEEIVDRCIPQASEYIGKKGVKKLVDMIGKETEHE